MQHPSIRRIWLAFALLALTVGMSGGGWQAGTLAQPEAPATPFATPLGISLSVEELQTQVAEQQATIEALEAQVARDQQLADQQATIEALETQVAQVQQLADQQAAIEALETQVAQIEKRVNQLSEASPTPAPEPTTTPQPTPAPEPTATPQPPPDPTPVPESQAASDGTLHIGETWIGDNWELTVTGYELFPAIESDYEEHVARGVFAVVYFTLVNAGNDPAAFPYDDLRLTTSEGRTYTSDQESTFTLIYSILDAGFVFDELQPGLPYTTGVAFDVPPDATGLRFTTSDEAFTFTLDSEVTETVATPVASPAAGSNEATVVAVDLGFEPEEMRIPADTDVTVILDNQAVLPHNWVVDELEAETETIDNGETTSIVVNAPAGEYAYYCSVPGHKEAGMVGTLIVEEGEPTTDGLAETGGSAFEEGDMVAVTESITLRPDPSTSGEPIAVVDSGEVLTVAGGPEEGETYMWWEVITADGTTGWVVEDFIEPAD